MEVGVPELVTESSVCRDIEESIGLVVDGLDKAIS